MGHLGQGPGGEGFVMVKINEAGVRALYRGIAAKLERADRRLRSEYEGRPVDEVLVAAQRMIRGLGMTVPDSKLREYAEAVAAGQPFKWVLT